VSGPQGDMTNMMSRLDECERLAKLKVAGDIDGMLTEIEGEASAAIEERHRHQGKMLKVLGRLKKRSNSLLSWMPEVRDDNERISELEASASRGDLLQISPEEVSELERRLEERWSSVPHVVLAISESHGPVRQGVWGTIQVRLADSSSFPIKVVSIGFPPEIEVKGHDRPFDLQESSEKTLDVGIRSYDAGTFPAPIFVNYQVPWDAEIRRFEHQVVLKVEVTEGFGRQPSLPATIPSSSQSGSKLECPGCTRPLRQGWKRCPYCGFSIVPQAAPVSKELVCPSCGEPLEPNWVRCPHCKVVLQGTSVESTLKY